MAEYEYRIKRVGQDWGNWLPVSPLKERHLRSDHNPPMEQVDIREKPVFEPGWYYRQVNSEQIELRWCRHSEPRHFPGTWKSVGEDFLDKELEFSDDTDDICY
jgi:hypothetical protein